MQAENEDFELKQMRDMATAKKRWDALATVGPCNTPEPSAWNAVEKSKWSSWKKLADMASTEAMRLFVKTLEISVHFCSNLKVGWFWALHGLMQHLSVLRSREGPGWTIHECIYECQDIKVSSYLLWNFI
ncbi:uncharacterized protein LOC133712819 isoform X2 [Rosa rugosa]|uniref:uncharacterized protein LOC133712819 isoform X2 n=1 Tax=Rosa rugosa TaxID=74645 RepID=UPI002B406276|nr:uncharacterized protein LOC133712819 isoform X2 [Rosa rugosa]